MFIGNKQHSPTEIWTHNLLHHEQVHKPIELTRQTALDGYIYKFVLEEYGNMYSDSTIIVILCGLAITVNLGQKQHYTKKKLSKRTIIRFKHHIVTTLPSRRSQVVDINLASKCRRQKKQQTLKNVKIFWRLLKSIKILKNVRIFWRLSKFFQRFFDGSKLPAGFGV